MIKKIRETVSLYRMINDDDRILLGLSGGPDSVFLMEMLISLRKEFNFTLAACHVNHCIRGSDAIRDKEFCAELCKKRKIIFFSADINIPEISAKDKISHEIAGRNERYKFFNNLCQKHGFNKIAVAHNMNDSVETLLINLTRGCSLNGMCGIKPVNGNIIRPIFNINRKDIETYLNSKEISYCTDSTNSEDVYTRNKIRNKVIYDLSEINPSFVETVFSNIYNFNEDNDFINECCNKINIKKVDNGVSVCRKDIDSIHTAVKKRVLFKALSKVSGSYQNFESKHINILLGSLHTGQHYNFPRDITVIVTDSDLLFIKNFEKKTEFEYSLIPGQTLCIYDNVYIKSDVVEYADFTLENTVYLDYDVFKNKNITIRSRKEGDRMVPYGMKMPKKLKQIFIDLKIPSYLRCLIPVVCDGDIVTAIVPYRINDEYKINNTTKNILRIQMIKEDYNDTI